MAVNAAHNTPTRLPNKATKLQAFNATDQCADDSTELPAQLSAHEPDNTTVLAAVHATFRAANFESNNTAIHSADQKPFKAANNHTVYNSDVAALDTAHISPH